MEKRLTFEQTFFLFLPPSSFTRCGATLNEHSVIYRRRTGETRKEAYFLGPFAPSHTLSKIVAQSQCETRTSRSALSEKSWNTSFLQPHQRETFREQWPLLAKRTDVKRLVIITKRRWDFIQPARPGCRRETFFRWHRLIKSRMLRTDQVEDDHRVLCDLVVLKGTPPWRYRVLMTRWCGRSLRRKKCLYIFVSLSSSHMPVLSFFLSGCVWRVIINIIVNG